ncbi:MAG: histidinol dehydrogenase, partial [Clostridia bacterium]|nr:histidinol dehydrogenase [Clostridia bacterium]
MIRIIDSEKVPADQVFSRWEPKQQVAGTVSEIIEAVRRGGDAVLREYTAKFDGVLIDSFEVPKEEIEEAYASVEEDFRRILARSAQNIRRFHEMQLRSGFTITDTPGIILGQKVTPVDRAGLYVPGGTAAYPSTVLMDAIPAKIAGVGEVVMTTPPGRDGKVNRYILAAARAAGIDRVFRVGGAQAIAALAYGTESIPRVDKIVGPGNAYVAEAKRQVYGQVSIDMVAGPSEILIIADGKSSPERVAADL